MEPRPELEALRLDALDGVRGLCALIVVVGHHLLYWILDRGGRGPALALLGIDFLTPVTTFIAASGFTLALVHPSTPSRSAFFRKRFARVAPIYYLSLILAAGPLLVYQPRDAASSVPLTLLALQSIPCLVGNAFNAPLWTVSALFICYLLYPWLMDRVRDLPARRALLLAGLLWGGTVAVAVLFLGTLGLGPGLFLHAFVGFRVPQFACGALAGLWARRRPLPRPTLAAEACTAAFLLAQLAVVVHTYLGGNLVTWTYYVYLAEFALLPAACLWFWALCDPLCAGPTRRLLVSRPLRFLGAVSYPLYCLHWPLLVLLAWAAAGSASPDRVVLYDFGGLKGWYFFPWWSLPLTTAACVAAAWAAHRLVEQSLASTSARSQAPRASELASVRRARHVGFEAARPAVQFSCEANAQPEKPKKIPRRQQQRERDRAMKEVSVTKPAKGAKRAEVPMDPEEAAFKRQFEKDMWDNESLNWLAEVVRLWPIVIVAMVVVAGIVAGRSGYQPLQ
eukprot:tig00021759_g23425.t1